MQKTRKRRIIDILVYILEGYLIAAAIMVVCQRYAMYHPSREMEPLPQGVESVQYLTADQLPLTAWYAPPTGDKPVIVMFHGNAGNISHRDFKQAFFHVRGYGFLLAEYRGYGPNKGRPTEKGFYEDGRAAMRWLIGTKQIPENQIVIYGESIGTGTATQMATEFKNARALVLEAPFTNMPNLVRHIYPWLTPFAFLAFDRYDNIAKMPAINMPVMVVHGTEDGVIPVSESRKLFSAVTSNPRKLVILEGGHHNDLADFGMLAEIDKFIASPPLTPSPPSP